MRLNSDDLLAELLLLPPQERARLAESLIASLDADPDVDIAWQAEIERRVADLETGAVQTVPAAEVFQRLRERLRGG